MTISNRLFFLILIVIALSNLFGCATTGGFGERYMGEKYPSTIHVEMYALNEQSVANLARDGHKLIGKSEFNGPDLSWDKAIAQAKKVGAEIVLVQKIYTGTKQVAIPQTRYIQGKTYTANSYNTGNINVYNSTGSASGNFSGYSTQYITTPGHTQKSYIPYSVDRYDFTVWYYKKINNSMSSNFNKTPTNDESKKNEREELDFATPKKIKIKNIHSSADIYARPNFTASKIGKVYDRDDIDAIGEDEVWVKITMPNGNGIGYVQKTKVVFLEK